MSRDHVTIEILWRTGVCRLALRLIDVDGLRPNDNAIVLKNRPEQETKLKNGEDGEWWVYLGPTYYQPIDDYLDNPDRYDVTDGHGREPLLTTPYGRPTGDTIL